MLCRVFWLQLTTYRDGGSSLRLACALFTGSYALIFSVGISAGEYDEFDSSSCRSSDTSCIGAASAEASPEAYRRQLWVIDVADGRTSLIERRQNVEDSSRSAMSLAFDIVLCSKFFDIQCEASNNKAQNSASARHWLAVQFSLTEETGIHARPLWQKLLRNNNHKPQRHRLLRHT